MANPWCWTGSVMRQLFLYRHQCQVTHLLSEWKHPLLLPAWKPTRLQGLSVVPGIFPLASDMWPPLGWDMAAELL